MSPVKKVIIHGLGTIAASVIEDIEGVEILGIVNDELENGMTQGKFKKIPVLGQMADIPELLKDENVYLISTYRDMKNERRDWIKLTQLKIPSDKWITIIHPTCIIPVKYSNLGLGIFMAPNVQLSTETTIGDFCVFYGNAFIGHDASIDSFCSIANHASIGAHVKIGMGSHIGSNSTIREHVQVGEFSLIGMGSVVTRDVPPNSIVAGAPAKIIGHK